MIGQFEEDAAEVSDRPPRIVADDGVFLQTGARRD
jgi:hypothetical protein